VLWYLVNPLVLMGAYALVFNVLPRVATVPDYPVFLIAGLAGHAFVCEPRARIRYRRHPGGLTGDVARLAEAGLAIHEAHADPADEALRTRARAGDLTALARGRVRQRRYGEARAALREAAALQAPARRERLLRALLAVPGLRAALGRRDPYRARARDPYRRRAPGSRHGRAAA
jgi:hypothetical protein